MWKLAFAMAAVAAIALCAVERPDLNGVWQLAPGQNHSALKAETLTIKQGEDSVSISDDATAADGKEHKFEYECNVEGRECKVKDNGVPKQLSLYYNGPLLVILEMWRNNSYVVKKTLKPSDDGKSLTMEVIPIAPAGSKNETYTFAKQ